LLGFIPEPPLGGAQEPLPGGAQKPPSGGAHEPPPLRRMVHIGVTVDHHRKIRRLRKII